jgi:hypothetical protein
MFIHRSRYAAMMVALLLLAWHAPAAAGTPDAIARARDLLARDDARSAVTVLEGALPGEPVGRTELLELLRKAYAAAAKQAESAGRQRDAEEFRDNLEILSRKLKTTGAPEPAPTQAALPPTAPVQAALPPAAKPEPRIVPAETPVRSISLPSPPSEEPRAPAAETLVPPPTDEPQGTVQAADAAFRAEQYSVAGRIYAALDAQGRLPKARRDHWAYCRWVDVVRRINAKPTSPQEWESIDAEIQKIRALSPNHWYGEYLRSRAAERPSARRSTRSNKLVVRGSAPEEPAPGASGSGPAPVATPPAPAPAPEARRSPATVGNWQVIETANFRILHADPALASRIAQVAEASREAQVKRWAGSAPRVAWSPRCDIYIYPTAKVFSRMTGQPEESPGFSTMGMNSGRIVARRVNLRADHPNLVTAILPHEITHVVLADLFPHQQIPRWADEGMAVLSEPFSEQGLRAADLEKPLASGQLFKVDDLMVMDYPDGKHWALYYAQSVSLTRFLVEQGSHTQFVQFVQGAQSRGLEAELRRVYKIEGFADLQKRWLEYARAKSSELTASADAAKATSTANR